MFDFDFAHVGFKTEQDAGCSSSCNVKHVITPQKLLTQWEKGWVTDRYHTLVSITRTSTSSTRTNKRCRAKKDVGITRTCTLNITAPAAATRSNTEAAYIHGTTRQMKG
jgi:hypothetical protein